MHVDPALTLAETLFDDIRAASLDPPGVSRASPGAGQRAASRDGAAAAGGGHDCATIAGSIP